MNQIGGLAHPRGLVPPFFVDFLKKLEADLRSNPNSRYFFNLGDVIFVFSGSVQLGHLDRFLCCDFAVYFQFKVSEFLRITTPEPRPLF